MYTLTFGTPVVGTDSATLPFTLDSAVTDGPYEGTASATGGGETKTGDVTVDANSTTGEIVFTGLSAGTTYTIAQGSIDITYGGNDQSLSHGGISFTTLPDEPRTATESQWQDLAARIKAKANASSLSSVATSGSYNDLSNKPTVPTITMTNVDPGEGSALAENNYVAVYGGDPIIMDYSTSEINTGAKWIDGSAIYKKTINTGALPNNTTKTVAHNISNLGTIINIQGIGISTTGRVKTLPMVEHNAEFTVPMSVYAGNIEITTYSDLSVYTRTYVTLYYTKSSS